MIANNAALVIIDVQKGFDRHAYWGGNRNNFDAEDHIARLLEEWRAAKRPIFHVQHMSTNPKSPLYPGQPGNEIKDAVKPLPGEPLIRKSVHSAFIGTNLDEQLRQAGVDTLVITGLTSDHCVSTTTRMARNMGYNVYLVADATATFDKTGHDGKVYPAEVVHQVHLASLTEFATVVETEQVLGAAKSL